MNNLKYIVLLLLVNSSYLSAQKVEVLPVNKTRTLPENGLISGKVQNKKEKPVQYATLYNLTQRTSCITDINGEFRLIASVGDSVRIRHLNYHTKELVIKNNSQTFILAEKEFLISEVIVSPQAAFDLFNAACENTWKTFKKENLSRAYCRFVRKTNNYVAQTADLDLDIVQKKQKRFKQGEQVRSYKVQERMEETGTSVYGLPGTSLNFFYPMIHQIYWVELPQKFNYYKYENEEFIVLRLSSKKDYNIHVSIEVSVNKNDTTLGSFTMVKKDLLCFSISNSGQVVKRPSPYDLNIEKTYHYIEYNYTDGFGYISEYLQGFVISEHEIKINKIEISQHLKTYNNGKENLKRRRNRRRIFDNTYNPLKTINRYNTEFWKNDIDWNNTPYDFEGLTNSKMGED